MGSAGSGRSPRERVPIGPSPTRRVRRPGGRWRLVAALALLLVALSALVLARPVHVHGDQIDQRVWLWAWQHGSVAFTNSVTGAPVRIDFGFLTGIDQQRMLTDEKTENYYTSGTYDLNQRLRGRRTRKLAYCSVVGIDVTLASHRYALADSCLEIRLLWPPF